jgi:apolipoprotein N-acyltransferase
VGILAVITLILMVLAVVLLGLATFWYPNPPSPARFNLGWAGLTAWALAELLKIVGGMSGGGLH